MAGVAEMVCFDVEFETGVLLNNFDKFRNVSSLGDLEDV